MLCCCVSFKNHVSNRLDTNDVADDYFTWKSMSTLHEQPAVGIVSSYWGGGFVAELGSDLETASNV